MHSLESLVLLFTIDLSFQEIFGDVGVMAMTQNHVGEVWVTQEPATLGGGLWLFGWVGRCCFIVACRVFHIFPWISEVFMEVSGGPDVMVLQVVGVFRCFWSLCQKTSAAKKHKKV